MSAPKGHAAFHVKHIEHGKQGTRGDRRLLLQESMRHLDNNDVQRHAAKNASIVPDDAHLNTGYVNDSQGGFRVAQSVAEVLDYGDDRVHRVRRKLTDKQTTVSTFVVHLPKTMCSEVANYYPRMTKDGQERLDPVTGEPMSRSRWTATDHEAAMRYFRDAVEYLTTNVIPGGHAAVHGWATNFDESTPHIQIMTDPFAPDPKAPEEMPDALRTEYSQAYRSHRDVKDESGKQLGGKEKLRQYQSGMREWMIERGWPVEQELGPRHGLEQSKAEYEQTQDDLAEIAVVYEAVETKIAENQAVVETFDLGVADAKAFLASRSDELDRQEHGLDRREASLEAQSREVDQRERGLEQRQGILESREAELPGLRRKAMAESEDARREAEEAARNAREAQQLADTERDHLAALIARQPPMPTREELIASQSDRPIRFLKLLKFKDGGTAYDKYQRWNNAEYNKERKFSAHFPEYNQWLQEVESETVGEVQQRYNKTAAQIEARTNDTSSRTPHASEHGYEF